MDLSLLQRTYSDLLTSLFAEVSDFLQLCPVDSIFFYICEILLLNFFFLWEGYFESAIYRTATAPGWK